jgi:acetyl-CoA carboxylase carboxyltransferase component
VYFNAIDQLEEPERSSFIEAKRSEYSEDVDLMRLAAEGVIDAVIEPEDLREELIKRYSIAASKDRRFSERRHGVPPV